VLGLLITDPAAAAIRPTKDVDVLLGTRKRAAHTDMEAALRKHGFRHDMSEGAPICRWWLDDILVDLLPVNQEVWGWESKWFAEALQHARNVETAGGVSVRVVTAPFLLATKLEAFKGRGDFDWYGSQDLEDIIALVDGRPELVEEAVSAPSGLRCYLATEISRLLATPGFQDAMPGHLPPDPASQRRLPIVLNRLRQIQEVNRD
ncbi:MAG: hypothetical protein WCH61_05090, partial [bacterium]